MRKKIIYIILLVLVQLFSTTELKAQACCSGGVPIGSSLGLGAEEKKSLSAIVTYDFNRLETLISGSEILDDDTRIRNIHSSILELNYGFSERLSIAAVIPHIIQERSIKGYLGAIEHTSTQGIGDVVLLLKYRPLKFKQFSTTDWIIGAGPKLPTGKTDHVNNRGLALVADMQSGSGSLDGMIWTYFQRKRFFRPGLSFHAVSTYRISGTNNAYNKVQAYKFGNELQLSLGLNYGFGQSRESNAFLFFRYRNQQEDIVDGITFPGSGGDWYSFSPGYHHYFTNRFSLRTSADIPVYRNLKETQLTTTYKFTVAAIFQITSKKPQSNFFNSINE